MQFVPSRIAFILALVAGLALPVAHAADPATELAGFSVFSKVDLAELANGKVETARSPVISNPRQLSVQAVYLVRQPVPKTADLLRHWDAARHPQLKVYLHGAVPSKPTPADFSKLADAPSAFFATPAKLDPNRVQMSQAEAAKFAPEGGKAGVVAFWSNLLAARAGAFTSGGLSAQPPYEGHEAVRASEEAAGLLKAQPKIRGQFSALPVNGGGGAGYWNVFDVEGQPCVSLGATSSRAAGDAVQLLDLRYYASGGLYVQYTFYQLWPVEVGGEAATLVWRGDLISSAALGTLRGVERTGSGVAMMREVEKTVNAFQKDATSNR